MTTQVNKQEERKVAIIKLRFHLITSIITLVLILLSILSKKFKDKIPTINPINKEKKVVSLKIR